jgi:hypothetical protein
MADTTYNQGKRVEWDWDTDTFKMFMVKEAPTLDADHDFVSDVLAANTECDFTNYARQTLTTPTFVVDDTNDETQMQADDITIAAAGGAVNNTIGAVIVYFEVTNDTDSPCLVAYDVTKTTNGAALTVAWPTDGVVKVV